MFGLALGSITHAHVCVDHPERPVQSITSRIDLLKDQRGVSVLLRAVVPSYGLLTLKGGLLDIQKFLSVKVLA